MHAKVHQHGHICPGKRELEPKWFAVLKNLHLQRLPFIGKAAAKGMGESQPQSEGLTHPDVHGFWSILSLKLGRRDLLKNKKTNNF